jgi:hypothetical protein
MLLWTDWLAIGILVSVAMFLFGFIYGGRK